MNFISLLSHVCLFSIYEVCFIFIIFLLLDIFVLFH